MERGRSRVIVENNDHSEGKTNWSGSVKDLEASLMMAFWSRAAVTLDSCRFFL